MSFTSRVSYLPAVFSPGLSFIWAISRLGIDSLVTLGERRETRAYIRTREYIMRVVRTLRSIIIQADEPAINERLLSLINVTYVITRR
jgi:hypothetical protein